MITNCGVGITTDKPLPARRAHDFYATDRGTIERTLNRYRNEPATRGNRRSQYPLTVLDPGAGAGVWGAAARELWPLTTLTGVEIRPTPKPAGYNFWLDQCDFVALYQGKWPAYNLVLGNPPFDQAEAFIRTALPVVHQDGHLIFLLRLAFLESVSRRDGLFREFPLKYVWVCSKRPSFQEDGKTNATAFAAFVWQKGWHGDTRLEWLK